MQAVLKALPLQSARDSGQMADIVRLVGGWAVEEVQMSAATEAEMRLDGAVCASAAAARRVFACAVLREAAAELVRCVCNELPSPQS
eukprot:scaffold181085_cov33-Prasinocladus_malaysianus.AAC.1